VIEEVLPQALRLLAPSRGTNLEPGLMRGMRVSPDKNMPGMVRIWLVVAVPAWITPVFREVVVSRFEREAVV